MALEKIENIDIDLMTEFRDDFNDEHRRCEDILLTLESRPQDKELLNALFRCVHNIKSNLVYVGLAPLSPVLQNLEDLLDEIRKNRIAYNSALSDVVLLTLDATQSLVAEQVDGIENDLDRQGYEMICRAIADIAQADQGNLYSAINRALHILDPAAELEQNESEEQPEDEHPHQFIGRQRIPDNVLKHFNVTPSEDLAFFQRISAPLESRSLYWKGRNQRLLFLALSMNRQRDEAVNPDQLAAAVLMHDFGMAFIPVETLHKKNTLSTQEKKLISSHVRLSYDVIHRMCHWEEAAEMVQQHHECVNGQGYPKGLSDLEICDGAKILAIVDCFDAITHERAHTSLHKRPFMRGLLEVNAHAGSQFSQPWVNCFNELMKSLN